MSLPYTHTTKPGVGSLLAPNASMYQRWARGVRAWRGVIIIAALPASGLFGLSVAFGGASTPARRPSIDITIDPDDGNFYPTGEVNVTVGVCGNSPFAEQDFEAWLNETEVTDQLTWVDDDNPSCNETYKASAIGTIQLPANSVSNFFLARVITDLDYELYRIYDNVSQFPTVTPDSRTDTVPLYASGSTAFTIANPEGSQRTYGLDVTCSGKLTACVVQPSITVSPAESATVHVHYLTAPSPGVQGDIVLQASREFDPAFSDEGTVSVVSVASTLPSTAVERDACLTIPAGTDGAYECGDLRLAHGLPTVRTFGKDRGPTLLYNSGHAKPHLLIPHYLKFPATGPAPGYTIPQSMVATLSIDGQTRTHSWPGSHWMLDSTRRIVVGFDGDLATGLYSYEIAIKAVYSGWGDWVTPFDTVRGKVIVVNRRESPYGAGWWVAGVEQLRAIGNDKLWIGGDGSARLYRGAADSVWRADTLDRVDSLTRSSGNYIRHLPNGAKVSFNSTGQHFRTENRLGFQTRFTYTGATLDSPLDSIVLPVRSGATFGYKFQYSSTPARLASVAAPGVSGARTTTIGIVDGQLRTIEDPDTSEVSFGCAVGTSCSRIEWRENRKGHRSHYSYDDGGKLTSARIDLAGGDSIRVTFTSSESRGYASTGSGTALSFEQARTTFDGPRLPSDAADTAAFWVNSLGAPARIRDALGNETVVVRADRRWPMLATELRQANGFVTRAAYNTRGLVDSTIAIKPHGPLSPNAVTEYTWHSSWEFPVTIRQPEGNTITFGYATNGNRDWQRPGGSSAHEIDFRYTADGLISSTALPGLSATDSIEYNRFGNVSAMRTPTGAWTYLDTDSIGRTTVVRSQIDTGTTLWKHDSTYYDASGRVERTTAYGPEITAIGTTNQWLRTRSEYDLEGNVRDVRRWGDPDTTAIDTVLTRWEYDWAGRAVKEIASDGHADSTAYDAAGNVIRTISRRGDTITVAYDALDRPKHRVLRAVHYAQSLEGVAQFTGTPAAQPYPQYPNDGTGYTIPRDSAVFTYDALGNVLTADNRHAKVTRTYHPNGQLATETQRVRTYAELGAGGDFSTHVYELGMEYDRNGRRTLLTHPAALGGYTTAFEYTEPIFGNLREVIGPLGWRYRYTYNTRGELDTLMYPGGYIRDIRTYDASGRLARQRIINQAPTTLANRYADSVFRKVDFFYDAQDRILASRNTEGHRDTVTANYSGLGHLVRRTRSARGVETWGATTRDSIRETFGHDAFGNLLSEESWTTFQRITSPGSGGTVSSFSNRGLRYETGTGRLRLIDGVGDDSLEYDAAGNTRLTWTKEPSGSVSTGPYDDRRSYYSAEGKLILAETRGYYGNSMHSVFEEFRYDALGRRVLVRTRRYCEDTAPNGENCRISTIRRTVWDGESELYEIQLPGATDVWPVSALEADTSAAVTDRYPNTTYGRVVYTHGLELDRPLAVTRIGYTRKDGTNTTRSWAPFTLHPLWNVRGEAEFGFIDQGQSKKCEPSHGNCVQVVWPFGAFASLQMSSRMRHEWHGTLIHQKQDGTGTYYRRNRQYDPATGRFTQEDPIGLAGGLNLYGYAGGDPVNFSDPFGLCPPCGAEMQEVLLGVGRRLAPIEPIMQGAAMLALSGPMGGGEGALVTLGLAAKGGQAAGRMATFYRGVDAVEAADFAAQGVLRASPNGNTGKYLTNSIAAAAQWAGKNGGQVLQVRVPADATRTFTKLGRIDGIGEAWFAPMEALKGAKVDVVKTLSPIPR